MSDMEELMLPAYMETNLVGVFKSEPNGKQNRKSTQKTKKQKRSAFDWICSVYFFSKPYDGLIRFVV